MAGRSTRPVTSIAFGPHHPAPQGLRVDAHRSAGRHAPVRVIGSFFASITNRTVFMPHRHNGWYRSLTRDLDAHAHQMIRDAGARSVYLGYHPSFGAMP